MASATHSPTCSDDDILDGVLALLAAGGPAAPRRRLLQALAQGGTPAAWSAAALRHAGLDVAQQQAMRNPDAPRLAAAREWLRTPGCRLLHLGEPDYPPLLRQLPDAPLALWLHGDAALLWRPTVAVVGSRAATGGGCDNAGDFARALAAAGLVVASGLARGIDAAAHRAALQVPGGLTTAVIGTGPDIAYPASHAGLQREVASAGVVVSEFWPGTGPLPAHFPRRNRVIAGLSLAVLVVEAAERSGALITARLAAAAGREVLALPGSIHNPTARGCHRLLRDGAHLVATPDEMIELLADQVADHARLLREQLGIPIKESATSAFDSGAIVEATAEPAVGGASGDAPGVDPDYKRLWSALDFDPIPLDVLVTRSGLTVARVSAILPLMELDGRVRVEHGRWSRKR
ncbi:MAG: DNA-processing protein DprA [Pseudoxanthomonas suwonensis]|nr:DNA-processing protein DprA [Pseudoxanthomonas suwonensis]